MAHQFVSGSQQYLRSAAAPVTSAPFSMACWYQFSTDAGNMLMCLGDKDTDNDEWCMYANAGGADFLFMYRQSGATTDTTNGGAIVKSTWSHACVSVAAVDDLTLYNDGSGVADTGSVPIANWDHISLGTEGTSSKGNYLTGYLAEAAVWNVALAQADVNMLVAGFSPLFVKPGNLVSYWPLIRDDNDRVGGYHLTPYNSPTWTGHYRALYPAPPLFAVSPGAAAPPPAASIVPMAFRHYQNLRVAA